MKPKEKFVRSIGSTSASNTVSSVDSATDDQPTRCECRNAQARHLDYELEQPSALGTTEEATSAIAGAAPMLVSSDLAERLASVLEQEGNPSLAVSTLAITSAVACQVAAQYTGESLTQVVERFVREFELSLPAVAATKRSGDERWH